MYGYVWLTYGWRGPGGARWGREHLGFLGDDAAGSVLYQRLELHRAGDQVLDADPRLPVAHVGERAHRVHGKLHLIKYIFGYYDYIRNYTYIKGASQFIVTQIYSENLIALTSSPTLSSWPKRSTSAKWKNIVCSLSTQRIKPKPSLKEHTTPCSRLYTYKKNT